MKFPFLPKRGPYVNQQENGLYVVKVGLLNGLWPVKVADIKSNGPLWSGEGWPEDWSGRMKDDPHVLRLKTVLELSEGSGARELDLLWLLRLDKARYTAPPFTLHLRRAPLDMVLRSVNWSGWDYLGRLVNERSFRVEAALFATARIGTYRPPVQVFFMEASSPDN